MIRSRCRSVDLSIPLETDSDGVISSLKWRSNFLCGVYREEISPPYIQHPGAKRDFPGQVSGRKKDPDFLKKKKYSLMVMKQSMKRVKTSKHEVYVVSNDNDCSNSPPAGHGDPRNYQTKTDKLISSRTNCEKIQTGPNIQEMIKSETGSQRDIQRDDQISVNFQTSQSRLFLRNYLKSKTCSSKDLHFGSSDNLHNVTGRSTKRTAQQEPKTLLTAIAVKDCVPSPYDTEALAFKKGDIIKVTEMNVSGLWRGLCGGREGKFKFIDVKTHDNSRETTKSLGQIKLRSRSVSDLLTAVHLENLTSVFVLNGYDTTDDIQHISEDDLDYLGIADTKAKDIILDTVQDLNINQQSSEKELSIHNPDDSGFNSSESGISTYEESYFLPHKSYLYKGRSEVIS